MLGGPAQELRLYSQATRSPSTGLSMRDSRCYGHSQVSL
jgi:hypothetical protein